MPTWMGAGNIKRQALTLEKHSPRRQTRFVGLRYSTISVIVKHIDERKRSEK